MSNLLKRAQNKLWRLSSEPAPGMSAFAANVTDEFKAAYKGRFAELFFANEGRLAHKWLHYLPIYEQLLSPYAGSKVRMLEIGVSKGGSLGLWRKFLGKEAIIFGVDINPECAAFDGESASVRIGSQSDPEFLQNVISEMGGVDVVLDDGSHIATHQRISFDALFPLLSNGGLYIIEDMHTAYWPGFEGGMKRRGTAIEFLKDKIDDLHAHFLRKGRNLKESMPDIESIQFFDSIAAVRKRKQFPRHHVMVPSPDRQP